MNLADGGSTMTKLYCLTHHQYILPEAQRSSSPPCEIKNKPLGTPPFRFHACHTMSMIYIIILVFEFNYWFTCSRIVWYTTGFSSTLWAFYDMEHCCVENITENIFNTTVFQFASKVNMRKHKFMYSWLRLTGTKLSQFGRKVSSIRGNSNIFSFKYIYLKTKNQ